MVEKVLQRSETSNVIFKNLKDSKEALIAYFAEEDPQILQHLKQYAIKTRKTSHFYETVYPYLALSITINVKLENCRAKPWHLFKPSGCWVPEGLNVFREGQAAITRYHQLSVLDKKRWETKARLQEAIRRWKLLIAMRYRGAKW